MVATTVMFFHKLGLTPTNYIIPLFVLTYVLAFLMVSGVKFHAFKDLAVVKKKPFSTTVAFVLVLALIAASPQIVPFFLCAGYVISGPILTAVLRHRERKSQEAQGTEDDSELIEEGSESDLSPKGLLS
jgi:CDP-diacylglycerol--serine O-phosphatidyltransferase